MSWIIALALLTVFVWLTARFALSGEDLSQFDQPAPVAHNAGAPPSPELKDVLQALATMLGASRGQRGKARLLAARNAMDRLGDDADRTGIRIEPVTVEGVAAEWVLPSQPNPGRRLLYLHGGAFVLGSPSSHRRITIQFARQLGFSVLAVDYRLMPEHKRLDGLEDCMACYRWISEQGPDGPTPAEQLVVAGDSAGGNLTLAVLAQVRDQGLRSPDAAIALSPATDGTFASPSLRGNISTDAMLGPTLGPVMKAPRTALLWITLLSARVKPTDPRISPLRGNLQGLPPTLVLASECEMLRDDAIRYVNKARAAGSPTDIVTWEHMIHVWQFFVPTLPEAQQSFDVMQAWLDKQLATSQPTGTVAA